MTSKIRLIAIDIDGTLQTSSHTITERTEKALKAAHAQGVQVVLATGKTRVAGMGIYERLGFVTTGIFMEGTVIYKADGTIRHQQTLDPQVARQIITFAEDRGYTMLANSDVRIFMRSSNARIAEICARYCEPTPEAIGPLQNILDDIPVHKLMAVGEVQRIRALNWQLKNQHNGAIKLTPVLGDTALEIMPPGASKGTALKLLMKDLKLSADQVMAIGDSLNDVEMLQVAGIGVAMGNARQQLKDIAPYIVASNDEDGVAEAIERFVLNLSDEKIGGSDLKPAV